MAAEAPLQDLVEEATCSICLDYFQDPVLIPECSHNYCRGCLTRSWGTSESEASCPQCRRTFAPRSLLPNRQLARMVEVARRCGGLWGEEGGSFCPKHREPLKLFCKDHGTLICVVCDRSKEHKGHSVIPAEEAFLEYQDIGSNLKKYQAKKTFENPVNLFLDPKKTIWDHSDMTVLLKSAIKKLRDTLKTGLKLKKVNVILDPETAHPGRLDISRHRKRADGLKPVKAIYPVPNRKRFEYNPYVLGCQKFSTGRHFWEVMVGDTAGWGVGVASKPVNITNIDEQTRHWQIGKWGEKYTAISPSTCSELVLTEEPTRIRISVNCEGGQVSFFDASTAALLHTFSDASLVGETLLPCFYLCDGTWLILL
ncbi:E3 ubiquitin-protein ligase TRIM41-like isoform X1 [Ahaetulla prasina]|uniref:E3 ubiquitin-protein ligase TRIM41-like isoform X1 n=1 Tax=Ahaetulla prasina TaxID=499056 RepID=UPI002649EDA3|nr:E3 ubiquitin-protein ligase TRIM41-like isoform X1 [Ahaetulla prasina]